VVAGYDRGDLGGGPTRSPPVAPLQIVPATSMVALSPARLETGADALLLAFRPLGRFDVKCVLEDIADRDVGERCRALGLDLAPIVETDDSVVGAGPLVGEPAVDSGIPGIGRDSLLLRLAGGLDQGLVEIGGRKVEVLLFVALLCYVSLEPAAAATRVRCPSLPTEQSRRGTPRSAS
jgi:hypothetical protein